MRIGIDVGGTHTRGAVVSEKGELVTSVERRTGFGDAALVASVLETVAELSRITDTTPSQIGIGVPGLVDSVTGVIRHVANLGIAQLALGDRVAEETGARVVVDNDVNAATLGAMRLVHADARTAPRSFAFINIGTGLGVGIVINGKLVRGKSGHAGELGHFPLGLTDRKCGCGQRGCVETSTSGSALTRFSPDRKSDTPLPDDFLEGLVALLRITTLTIDPASIVLGGGVVLGHKGFMVQTLRALAEHDTPGSFISELRVAERVSVAPSSHLGALGAALLPSPLSSRQVVPVG